MYTLSYVCLSITSLPVLIRDMKVHFSASIENITSRIELYRTIRQTLVDNGDVLTRDWIDDAFERASTKTRYSQSDAKDIAAETRRSIENCDIAIFESSDQSFGVGYQAALSINLQKPVLILLEKNARPLGVIGTGQNTTIKKIAYYHDKEEMQQIIRQFIDDNSVLLKDLRFNMLLDRELLYFVNNESIKTGLSKSQVIRSLIKAKIDSTNNI